MDRITRKVWGDINKMDHFSYASISAVIGKRVTDIGLELVENRYATQEGMPVLLGILWVLVAEGFNHLSLVGRHIGLGTEAINKVLEFLLSN